MWFEKWLAWRLLKVDIENLIFVLFSSFMVGLTLQLYNHGFAHARSCVIWVIRVWRSINLLQILHFPTSSLILTFFFSVCVCGEQTVKSWFLPPPTHYIFLLATQFKFATAHPQLMKSTCAAAQKSEVSWLTTAMTAAHRGHKARIANDCPQWENFFHQSHSFAFFLVRG